MEIDEEDCKRQETIALAPCKVFILASGIDYLSDEKERQDI